MLLLSLLVSSSISFIISLCTISSTFLIARLGSARRLFLLLLFRFLKHSLNTFFTKTFSLACGCSLSSRGCSRLRIRIGVLGLREAIRVHETVATSHWIHTNTNIVKIMLKLVGCLRP
jgi:hypothetical protein